MDRDKLFIDGEWVEPAGTATIEVISPLTEEVIATVPEAIARPTSTAPCGAAVRAFDAGPWPRMTPGGARRRHGEDLASSSRPAHEEVAKTITEEMGSPISFSIMGQVFASTMVLDYYTGLAREYQFEEVRQGMLGPGPRAQGAGRRGRRDRAVERAAVHRSC